MEGNEGEFARRLAQVSREKGRLLEFVVGEIAYRVFIREPGTWSTLRVVKIDLQKPTLTVIHEERHGGSK